MIASSIYVKEAIPYPKALQTAIDYLKAHDFAAMEPGVYPIDGEDIYAQVFDAVTEPAGNRRPEVHEQYIDVQFLVTGKEKLGFTPDTGSYEVAERIDERDLIFYKSVENEGYIYATPGCYSIFFPSDVHRPAVEWEQSMSVRKVVVKVKASLM